MEPHDFFTALAAWTGCLTEAIFSGPFPWFFHIRETIILLPCPIALWKYWKCEWKTRLYTFRRSEGSPEGKTVTVSHISLHKTLYSQWQIECVSMEGWYVTRFLLSREVIQRVSAVDGLSGCHVYCPCNNFTRCIQTVTVCFFPWFSTVEQRLLNDVTAALDAVSCLMESFFKFLV